MPCVAEYKVSQRSPLESASFETLEKLAASLGAQHQPGFELCFVYENGERISNERFIDVVIAMMVEYIKKDATHRLKYYAVSGNTTDQLVETALFKKYGIDAATENSRERDFSKVIKRIKKAEDQLQMRFSGLRAELNENSRQIEVMGQIQSRKESSYCPDYIEIVVDALDSKRNILDTATSQRYEPADLFPFLTFKQVLNVNPVSVEKIRVYPKGVA